MLSQIVEREENRIDTLFVDKGFGSLDPNCLEKAVVVLQELRQDKRNNKIN
jgi:DNA repair exonuclease SbcCD ATPase subunit